MAKSVLDKRQVHRSANFFLDNFLKGLIIMAPLTITLGAVMWMFKIVDDILPNIIQFFLDIIFIDGKTKAPHIFGLGFVVFILAVVGIGYFSSFFLFNKLIRLCDRQLLRTPGLKIIYMTVKDIVKTFKSDKKQFDKPVWFSIDEKKDVWRMGFITADQLQLLNLGEDFVAVYVPMSFSVAGLVYLVKRDRVRILKGVSSSDAMKFLLSGGFVHGNTPEDMPEDSSLQTSPPQPSTDSPQNGVHS